MLEEACRKISDAEWRVMRVLWESSPLNTTQIIEELKPEIDWSPKTVHSLISRLVKKGALGVNKELSQYLYYPLVPKEECVKEETKSFIKRVYDDSAYLMVANFIEEDKLSAKEIEKLKQILNEKLK